MYQPVIHSKSFRYGRKDYYAEKLGNGLTVCRVDFPQYAGYIRTDGGYKGLLAMIRDMARKAKKGGVK